VSKTIDLEHLRFEFGEAWDVYKIDEEQDLLKIKDGVSGTKDADIIGILHGRNLYVVEVTDLRGHRIENRSKLLNSEMVQEFCQKVRDTIPAVVGAFHATEHTDRWIALMQKLADRSNKIRVILWIEQDQSRNGFEHKKRKSEMSSLIRTLKKHLKWLTPRVFVESQHTYRNDLEFVVTNLPGAGQN
jgi:hypothetical protein